MNNVFFALSNLAGVIPSSRIGTSRTTQKPINLFKKEKHMLKNLPALKNAYQTAFEYRRQVHDNESLLPNTQEHLNSRIQFVEAANKVMNSNAGVFTSPESVARQYAAKTRLNEAMADQEASAKELSILVDTLDRLRTSAADATAELLVHTEEAISEITQSHKISVEKDQKLRQMMLELFSAHVLATQVRNRGITGFSQQEVVLSISPSSDWYYVVLEFFREIFTSPSEAELEASLVAFKEKYGFSSLDK